VRHLYKESLPLIFSVSSALCFTRKSECLTEGILELSVTSFWGSVFSSFIFILTWTSLQVFYDARFNSLKPRQPLLDGKMANTWKTQNPWGIDFFRSIKLLFVWHASYAIKSFHFEHPSSKDAQGCRKNLIESVDLYMEYFVTLNYMLWYILLLEMRFFNHCYYYLFLYFPCTFHTV